MIFGSWKRLLGVPTVPIAITQRIVTNFFTAKRMLHALMMTLQRHEATFGVSPAIYRWQGGCISIPFPSRRDGRSENGPFRPSLRDLSTKTPPIPAPAVNCRAIVLRPCTGTDGKDGKNRFFDVIDGRMG